MKRIQLFCCRRLILAGLFTLSTALAVPPPAGIAPVAPPPNGFDIDGNLLANTPTANIGDWVANTNLAPGSGGGVLSITGVPIDTNQTFHFVDPYNDTSNDRIFTGGNKWLDNPNSWGWTGGKPSSKTDINNSLLHLTLDTNGHIWAVLAADRYSTSGDSYIDFELLQNLLTRNANGTFTSAGPHGGRTTNDILLSLAFTGGGKVADFFAWRWMPNGSGGYTYEDITALLPTNRVFVALNTNTINSPYPAFGGMSYDANAFVEAAIDLTGLLGNFDQCESFGFKTIMIKTKASSSSSASIEDFIDPIQYTLNIGPSANAGSDQTRCIEGAETVFALNGNAASGIQPIATNFWTVVSGTATIDSPTSLVTTARVSSASATLRLTVVQVTGCSKTDDVVLGVQQPPVCSITGPTTLCPRTTNTYSAPAGMNEYAWSVSGNGFISGAANQQTVKIVAGNVCGQSYTITLTTRSNACTVSCSTGVLVTDTGVPLLTCPPDRILDCPAVTTTNATGVATATDSCSRVTVTYSDSVTNGCGVSQVIARTWTATDECGNSVSCVQKITVRDITRPTISCPPNRTLQCPADTSPAANGAATATDLCGSANVTFSDAVTTNCGNTFAIARTWTATDLCNNSTSCVQIITVLDTTAPVITCPPSVTLQCPADTSTNANGVATATDACGSASISFSDSVTNLCGVTQVIRRTWTARDACGNQSSCLQTITVRDTTPPVITCPPNVTLECPGVTTTNVTGVATAVDACGAATISFSDSTTNLCGNTKIITRTWTASDVCSNKSSCVQLIRVVDTTAPALVCAANKTVECTTPWAFDPPTATDGCGTNSITIVSTTTNATCGNAFIATRTWRAVDACGNQSTCSQTVTVRDTTPPVITCPAGVTLECPANISTNVNGVATATDTCGAVTITFSDSSATVCGNARIISRIWRATDLCGNASTCVQTLTVRDTTPPVITCPAAIAIECGSSTSPGATGTATATDTCSTPSVTYSDTFVPLCGGSRIITRTWTATDPCGNKVSCPQTITVRDTTPPAIAIRVVCTYSQGGWSGGGGTADLLRTEYNKVFPQGVTLGISAPTNGTAAPNGLFWQPTAAGLAALQSAMDVGGGSSSSISQDAVNPSTTYGAAGLGRQTLALTMNIAFNEAGYFGAGPNNFGSLVYTKPGDSLSGKTVKEILAVINRALAGLGLPAGYDFSSLSGLANDLNISFHDCAISSFANNYLSTPGLLATCASQVPPPNPNLVNYSDSCSSVILSSLPDVITNQICANRLTLIRTWVATDACSNSASASMLVIVNDEKPPTISCPANVTVDYPASVDPSATGTASAADNCGTVNVNFADSIVTGAGNARTITRTWTALDTCNNATNCVQVITVRDTTPPLNRLVISPSGATGILLRWPTNAVGYRLECATNSSARRWSPMPVVPIVTNGECRVYLTKPGHCQFFRLANTPPYLEGAKLSGGNLRLTWPTAPSGFVLEASDTMANGNWLPVAITPGVSNALNHVTVPALGIKKFYRLKK